MLALYNHYGEYIRYGLFGVLTTVINLLTFYGLYNVNNISHLWANSISIVVSVVFAYIVNKKYVFQSKTDTIKEVVYEMGLFGSARLVSASADMLLMWMMVDILQLQANVAKLITEVFVVVINYSVSKYIVFDEKEVNRC